MSMFSIVRSIILTFLGAKESNDNSGVKVTFGGVVGIALVAAVLYLTTGKIDGGMIAEMRSLISGTAPAVQTQSSPVQHQVDVPKEKTPSPSGPRVIDGGDILIIPRDKK
ncbi:MAG: hypothetical protein WCK33_06685 [Phycisphaerae bacterium]|jgi:hypothetical protein